MWRPPRAPPRRRAYRGRFVWTPVIPRHATQWRDHQVGPRSLDLIFCLYPRTRQSGRGKKSDAICRCYRSKTLFRGVWLQRRCRFAHPCGLYSITTNQAAIIALFRVINRYVGNLQAMPGVFPDYPAPVVCNDGAERELAMMRWGMPPPQRAGGFPVINIRHLVTALAWMAAIMTYIAILAVEYDDSEATAMFACGKTELTKSTRRVRGNRILLPLF
jgi:hypothetical protein